MKVRILPLQQPESGSLLIRIFFILNCELNFELPEELLNAAVPGTKDLAVEHSFAELNELIAKHPFMMMTAEFSRDGHLTTYHWQPDQAIYSTPGGGIK
ncbi:MAG: hypothetical protein HC938_07370 [Nitrospira sp.]|nr:hypothetical protein [Nitrospira sp.]